MNVEVALQILTNQECRKLVQKIPILNNNNII
jgi:hypothetical protein